MTRNLRERVEVLIPILDTRQRQRLEDILKLYWSDNTKAHAMQPAGNYVRLYPHNQEIKINAQATLLENPTLDQNLMPQPEPFFITIRPC